MTMLYKKIVVVAIGVSLSALLPQSALSECPINQLDTQAFSRFTGCTVPEVPEVQPGNAGVAAPTSDQLAFLVEMGATNKKAESTATISDDMEIALVSVGVDADGADITTKQQNNEVTDGSTAVEGDAKIDAEEDKESGGK